MSVVRPAQRSLLGFCRGFVGGGVRDLSGVCQGGGSMSIEGQRGKQTCDVLLHDPLLIPRRFLDDVSERTLVDRCAETQLSR